MTDVKPFEQCSYCGETVTTGVVEKHSGSFYCQECYDNLEDKAVDQASNPLTD